MKGEYLTNQQHQNLQTKHESPTLFSKLHPPHPHTLPFSPHFQLSRDSEDDTATTTTTTPPKSKPSSSTDGATIEVVRRPRGRPPGSKNKPKPPVIITRDPEPVMSPYILQVPAGNDVVEAIARFCREKNIGVCVLTGSGAVANVTLRQPCNNSGATITFHGRFDILSISATFLPQTMPFNIPTNFTISLAGPQCQIVGGLVAGSLVAAGTVFVIAASFNNPSYHRLPSEEEARNSGSGGNGEAQSPAVSGQGGESGNNNSNQGGGGEVPMYSCHLGSDVIWAPTARPPPPY